MNADALGDQIDFDLLDNALLSIGKKGEQGAVAKVTQYYAYYESMKKFACAICVSTIEGDETKAIEHVKHCLAIPDDAAKTGRTFCAVCWRSFSSDNIAHHFNSVGHSQSVDRITANGMTETSVWVMKNGPSFVRPKKEDCQRLDYGVMNGIDRIQNANNIYSTTRIERIREQITNAIRAASGNFGTANAKLSSSSPLVMALVEIEQYTTIGAMPCKDHRIRGDYPPADVLKALTEVLQGPMAKLLETRPGVKCAICGANIEAFKSPLNAFRAIQRIEKTIVGEYLAEKKNVEPAKTSTSTTQEVEMSDNSPKANFINGGKKVKVRAGEDN